MSFAFFLAHSFFSLVFKFNVITSKVDCGESIFRVDKYLFIAQTHFQRQRGFFQDFGCEKGIEFFKSLCFLFK